MATANWIPVATRLPDDDTLVLIACSDQEVWTGYRDGDIWRDVSAMPLEPGFVTHWMPLPAHPDAQA
jgi:hypothetical protein